MSQQKARLTEQYLEAATARISKALISYNSRLEFEMAEMAWRLLSEVRKQRRIIEAHEMLNAPGI